MVSRSVCAVKSRGMLMPFRRVLRLAAIVIGATVCQDALAQRTIVPPEPPEYLVIQNRDDKPVSVHLKPRLVRLQDGRVVGNARWFKPVSVDAAQVKRIRLPGYEPFDIAILRDDGTAYTAGSVYLCQIMVDCVNNNWTNWTFPMVGWRWQGGRYIRDSKLDQVFDSTADGAKVAIQFSPVFKASVSLVTCSFLVVDGNDDAVVGATLVFSTSKGESLGIADQVTDADGKANVALAENLPDFHVRVIKVGVVEQKEFRCRVITDLQKLRVQNRRQLPIPRT
jgi:hypothetical protein